MLDALKINKIEIKQQIYKYKILNMNKNYNNISMMQK